MAETSWSSEVVSVPLWSWALEADKKRGKREKTPIADAISQLSYALWRPGKKKMRKLMSSKEMVIDEVARRLNVDRETAERIYWELESGGAGRAMLRRARGIVPSDEDLRLLKKLVEKNHPMKEIPALDLLHFLDRLGLLEDKELRDALSGIPPDNVKNAIMSAYLASRDEREFVQRLRELAVVMAGGSGGSPRMVRWNLSDVARLIEETYYKERKGISNVRVEINGEILAEPDNIIKNVLGKPGVEVTDIILLRELARGLRTLAKKIKERLHTLEAEAAEELQSRLITSLLAQLEAIRSSAEATGGVDIRVLKKILRDVQERKKFVERAFELVKEWERGNKEAFFEEYAHIKELPEEKLEGHKLLGDLEKIRRRVASGDLSPADAANILMALHTMYSVTETLLQDFLSRVEEHMGEGPGPLRIRPDHLEKHVIGPLKEKLKEIRPFIRGKL